MSKKFVTITDSDDKVSYGLAYLFASHHLKTVPASSYILLFSRGLYDANDIYFVAFRYQDDINKWLRENTIDNGEDAGFMGYFQLCGKFKSLRPVMFVETYEIEE